MTPLPPCSNSPTPWSRAGSIEEIRQAEAAAANVYLAAWERRVFVSFARKDLPRIPAHWTAVQRPA